MAFKDVFDKELLDMLAARLMQVYPQFDRVGFVSEITPQLKPLELKERVELTTQVLHTYLPENYPEAAEIIVTSLGDPLPDKKGVFGTHKHIWLNWPLTNYVAKYGLKDYDISMHAIEELTQRFSCEFAIRHFIIADPEKAFNYFETWVSSPSHHVRRLVSEGTRPYLPWGLKLDLIEQHPEKTLPLLRKLRNDSSEYVRTSVVNHLNDLTRKNLPAVLNELREWHTLGWDYSKSQSKALRSSIKRGDQRTMEYLGFAAPNISIESITLTPSRTTIGGEIEMSFELFNQGGKPQKLQVDYVVGYINKKGGVSPKVYKLKTLTLSQREVVSKKILFKDNSIRTHNPGVHTISLQINGQIFPLGEITLHAQ